VYQVGVDSLMYHEARSTKHHVYWRDLGVESVRFVEECWLLLIGVKKSDASPVNVAKNLLAS
jgi:hypothetical protein